MATDTPSPPPNSEPTVLVTGIGGNVGQGILRNIRSQHPEIRLVGVNVVATHPGLAYCDHHETVPYYNDPTYLPRLHAICTKHEVDLIIPATDFETLSLSQAVEGNPSLPPVLSSPHQTCTLCVDKWLSYQHLQPRGIPFADSCLPQDFSAQWPDYIVKPRSGRGSRGIHINPDSVHTFSDENLVQAYQQGTEVTTAFYVKKDGQLHAHVTMERELSAGTTVLSHIVHHHDHLTLPLIQQLMEAMTITGPCNVQSIITEEGDIVPFEINCRYSGTNSIRSQFGFPDVSWGIQEYLFNREPEPAAITTGTATRILLDLIYPNTSPEEIQPGQSQLQLF